MMPAPSTHADAEASAGPLYDLAVEVDSLSQAIDRHIVDHRRVTAAHVQLAAAAAALLTAWRSGSALDAPATALAAALEDARNAVPD